jgi:pfkB family carbohydrate kinase
VSPGARVDYTTVGHVTIDVLPDGTRRPGGTAFYSALQASRLGLRALILTRGAVPEIERLLEPYCAELELEIQPSDQTTTLRTWGTGATRRQRLLAWAGPIEGEPNLDTSILHLAPVARESPGRWRGEARFVGLTPQGLVREWAAGGGEISLTAADPAAFPERCDALVISEVEQVSCAELVSRAMRAGTVVAVTAGHRPTVVHVPGRGTLHVPTPATEEPGDDIGAGDVFAAAFFIALREGQPAAGAAAFAAAAAALRIAGPGASSIAGRDAIDARVRAGAQLTS